MPQAIVATHRSNGGRLVSVDGRELPLRNAAVSGEARGGLARVTLKQTFSNPHPEPMKVTYMMPLPADGAVAGYEFRIGPRRVVGEIDARGRARERFEQALIEGRTAGILDQERANLFTQEIGNVPPGTEVAVELTIDQPLLWLPEGMWEWRFPTVAPPRYLGAEGRVPDAPDVTVEVADRPLAAVVSLDLVIGDALTDGRRPESPSHGLSVGSRMPTRVTLAGDSRAAPSRPSSIRSPIPTGSRSFRSRAAPGPGGRARCRLPPRCVARRCASWTCSRRAAGPKCWTRSRRPSSLCDAMPSARSCWSPTARSGSRARSCAPCG